MSNRVALAFASAAHAGDGCAMRTTRRALRRTGRAVRARGSGTWDRVCYLAVNWGLLSGS